MPFISIRLVAPPASAISSCDTSISWLLSSIWMTAGPQCDSLICMKRCWWKLMAGLNLLGILTEQSGQHLFKLYAIERFQDFGKGQANVRSNRGVGVAVGKIRGHRALVD